MTSASANNDRGANRRRGGYQTGRGNDANPRGQGRGGRNSQKSDRGYCFGTTTGRGDGGATSTPARDNHGGAGMGRGRGGSILNGGRANVALTRAQGSADRFAISTPAPSSFSWATHVREHEQPALLESIRAIVQHPNQLKGHTVYRNVSHLLKTPSQVHDARRCRSCCMRMDDAELPGNTRCQQTQSGHHDIPPFKEEANGRFFALAADPSVPKRAFVVLDAEFIYVYCSKDKGNTEHETVVGKIAVIDGLTGEVLLNHYVMPEDRGLIKSLQSAYSGIQRHDVDAAYARGGVIRGLAGLNKEMAKFVDANTIVAGHALHNDLKAAKFSHNALIDTQLLFEHCCGTRYPGLKKCMAAFLGHPVQQGKTHDALEDACATRELVFFKAGYAQKTAELETVLVPVSSGEEDLKPVPASKVHQISSTGVAAASQVASVAPVSIDGTGLATVIGTLSITGSANITVVGPKKYPAALEDDW